MFDVAAGASARFYAQCCVFWVVGPPCRRPSKGCILLAQFTEMRLLRERVRTQHLSKNRAVRDHVYVGVDLSRARFGAKGAASWSNTSGAGGAGRRLFAVKRHYPAGKCEGAPSERFRARIPLRISEPSLDAACVVCPLARYPAFSMPSRLNSSLRECTSSFW